MKVLLIKPRIAIAERGNMFPPLNLLSIGSIIKRKGIEVRILDQQAKRIKEEGLIEYIKKFQPDVIGVNSMTPEIFSAYKDIDLIKKKFPDIKIILGGSHVSCLPENTLKENPNIDIAVIGEGEKIIGPLLDCILETEDLKNIKGIAYRDKDKIIVNQRETLIENLDEIPFPDYNLVDIEDYAYRQRGWGKRKFMSMLTSRGCPFLCTFCAHGVFGRKIRMHSAEYIIKHNELLYNKYGIRGIGIMDDTFTINKKRVLDFCNLLIEKNLDLIWYCLSTVNTVDEEMLTAMKNAGCVKISYGVESGDEKIQERIKKYLDLTQVKKAFEISNKLGIETLAFFMIGHPGETKKTIKKTKQFAKKINPDFISVAILCPFPGSDIYEEFKHQLPTDWSRYQMTPFTKQPVLKLGELSLEALQKEMKRFYREFYYRPSYILSRIKKIKNIKDLSFYIKKAIAVSKDWF